VGGRTDMTTIEMHATAERPHPAAVATHSRVDRATRLQTGAAVVALLLIAVLGLIALLGD
jgi:hypothetical protein